MKKMTMKAKLVKLILISSLSALVLTACMKKEKPEAEAEQSTQTETEVQDTNFQDLDQTEQTSEYTDLDEVENNDGTAEITASDDDADSSYSQNDEPPRAAQESVRNDDRPRSNPAPSSSASNASASSSNSANQASTVSDDVVNDKHAVSSSGDATEDDAVAAAMKAAQPALQ